MTRLRLAAALATGLLLGAVTGAAAFWALTGPLDRQDLRFGSWTTAPQVGRPAQNPYARARVALYGIWGLPSSEVLYFVGDRDADGASLRRSCTYVVHGRTPPARFWSLTLYRDGFFILNPANRYSWSSTDAAVGPAGDWTVMLAPVGEGRDRLTFGPAAGAFHALLRLYQPAPGLAEHRDRVPLPRIDRLGCVGDRAAARS